MDDLHGGIPADMTEPVDDDLSTAARRASEAQFGAIFDDAVVGMVLLCRDGRVVRANRALGAMLGYGQDELSGMPLVESSHTVDVPGEYQHFAELFDGRRRHYRVEKRYVRGDGGVVWANVTASLIRDDGGRPSFAVAMVEDVTERKTLREQLAHQSFHDPLTDLPTRGRFMDLLTRGLERARRRECGVAVLMLDLDRFKVINDGLGRDAGDALLVAVGRRLATSSGTGTIIARFGGDRFVVLLQDVTHASDPICVAERIVADLRGPFALDGREVFVTASIGIALSGSGQDRASGLLSTAELALEQAKANGKARYELFHRGMDSRGAEIPKLESDLHHAIERGELRGKRVEPKPHGTRCRSS